MPILRVKSVKIYMDISVGSVTNIRYGLLGSLSNIYSEKVIFVEQKVLMIQSIRIQSAALRLGIFNKI